MSDILKNKKKPRKKNKKKSQLPFIMIFIVGLLVLLYPQVSRLYYRVESNFQVEDFEKAKKALTDDEVNKRIELARAYNSSLNSNVPDDPYDKKKQSEGVKEYARMLEVKEKIGHIEVPKIDVDIPIYAGTTEDILQKGAGHLEGTSLPVGGKNTHTVITAHSGLPTAKLFSDLNKIKIGDEFYIHNISYTMAYKVDQIITVLPSDFDDLLVVKGRDYATLLTCTPIMINTHRLLVRGHRIPYVPNKNDEQKKKNDLIFYTKCFAVLLVILMLILWIWRKFRKQKKQNSVR